MLSYQDLAIAEQWLESLKDFNKLIAAMQNDLDSYSQKDGANQKRIEILTETILRMKNFASITKQLIDRQKDFLLESGSLQSKHSRLLEDHRILKGYAISRGCDMELLPYLTLKDFSA